MGLSFTIAAGPRQRIHSQVRVPRDSWPYLTVSDSRLRQHGVQSPCIYEYIAWNRVAQLYLQALGSIFVASYDSQGYGGGIRTRLHWVKVTLRPDIYYCLTLPVLFLCGALSDERTGLSFVHAAGPCQRSLSLVQVPWDFCRITLDVLVSSIIRLNLWRV
jgi:hypothetical protein